MCVRVCACVRAAFTCVVLSVACVCVYVCWWWARRVCLMYHKVSPKHGGRQIHNRIHKPTDTDANKHTHTTLMCVLQQLVKCARVLRRAYSQTHTPTQTHTHWRVCGFMCLCVLVCLWMFVCVCMRVQQQLAAPRCREIIRSHHFSLSLCSSTFSDPAFCQLRTRETMDYLGTGWPDVRCDPSELFTVIWTA